eukprot:2935594-Lingulodinium_polyedra.AAC.1
MCIRDSLTVHREGGQYPQSATKTTNTVAPQIVARAGDGEQHGLCLFIDWVKRNDCAYRRGVGLCEHA